MRSVILVLIGLALAGVIRPAHIVRAQAPAPSGTVLTIAGTGAFNYSGDGGPATSASFRVPLGTAIGPDGSIYLADNGNFRIRRINLATGFITTVAGNGSIGDTGDGGPATSAQISGVLSLAVDDDRNALYFADFDNNKVRKVDLTIGTMTRYAGAGNCCFGNGGDGGPATLAELAGPISVATDGTGKLSIANLVGDSVRRVNPVTGIITTIAPIDNSPESVTADSAGNVYVKHSNPSGIFVSRIDAVTGIVTVVAGGGANSPSGGSGPATGMNIGGAQAVSVSATGELFIVSTGTVANNQVWKVNLASGVLSVYAGAGPSGFSGDGGPALNAKFGVPQGVTVSPAGEVLVSDTGNQRIRYIVPNAINLVGSAQTALRLPWISSLSGNFIVTDNPLLAILDAPFLTSVAGTVNVSGNASALGDLSSLTTVGGSVSVNGNTSAAVIDLGALTSAGSNVNVNGNTSAVTIDLGALTSTDGSVSVNGNTSAATIDLSGLTSAGGSVSVNGNDSAATVDFGALTNVGGDLTLETTGSGLLDLDGLDVGGDTSVTADGYTTVEASTADGTTAVTMIKNEATMEVTLPDGAFSSANPVTFSVQKLPVGGVETVGGEMVTHLETYAFDFAIPTLNSAAELNFEIDLVALAVPDRLLLLDLLHESAELTLGVRGDAPGAELQLFDVCSGTGPAVDGCVVVQWLDATRMLLDPLGSIDPSILRFEALVGHFSTYSVVAVGLAGDYNHNGRVDAADYVVWRNTLGESGTDLAADGNNSGTIDSGDYDVWRAHFGQTAGSGSGAGANVAVPEPATCVLLVIAATGLCPQRRRNA